MVKLLWTSFRSEYYWNHLHQNIAQQICSGSEAQRCLKLLLERPDTTWGFKVPEVSLIPALVKMAKQQISRAGVTLWKENVSLKFWVGGVLFLCWGGGWRGEGRLVVCFALFCVGILFVCLFVFQMKFLMVSSCSCLSDK